MREFAHGINHQQPGDPEKFADGLLALAAMPNPPVRLPFGSDTLAAIEEKNAQVADAIATHRALSLSTDFAEAAQAA
ncbi:short chain dehydrogenase [compost metagenome]